MEQALENISPFEGSHVQKRPFPIPEGIVTAVIDPVTGLLALGDTEDMVEYFKEGTVPTVYSTVLYRDLIMRQKEDLARIEKKKGSGQIVGD